MQNTIKLGKQTFKVPLPRGTASWALQQRIIPIAGQLIGVLAAIYKATKKGGASMKEAEVMENLLDANIDEILPIALPHLSGMFATLPPGEFEAILVDLLQDTTCDGVPLFNKSTGEHAFDGIMMGRTLDTWKLLWHAIKVWYPDFLSLAAMFTAKGGQAESSDRPATSAPSGPASDWLRAHGQPSKDSAA